MEPTEVLQERFGLGSFRPGQPEVIASILEGRPTLAVMPTGSGKSLCYQLPAVMLDGITVVVSPLVALIRDQIRALESRGIAARSITSHDDHSARTRALKEIREGRLDLVYVAPERFRSSAFVEALRAANIAMFAVDEAHCISQWGHDFRPDYARLGDVIAELRPERVAALTATATPAVREDICLRLQLSRPNVIVTGFDRENLELRVVETRKRTAKLARVTEALEAVTSGAAIVYVATRKKADEVASALGDVGFDAHAYHAGMSGSERRRVELHFDAAPRPVVVATTAFGMGIDRADVRAVVHFQIPGAPEAYYQEVGRAGRDGQPAVGLLVWDQADLRHAHLRYERSCPTPEAVEAAFQLIQENGALGFEDLVAEVENVIGPSARAAVIALEQSGSIRIDANGVRAVEARSQVDPKALNERARRERGRLDAMIGYVTRAACRRRYLVDYFGDPRRPDACGLCDRCSGPPPTVLQGDEKRPAMITLSCIARMRGRYGKGRVVEVLVGSESDAVLGAGLDRLSTHGLLSTWTKKRTMALIDGLVRGDYARIAGSDYPTIRLTERGAAVLKDEAPLALDMPEEKTASARPATASVEPGAELLFDALKSWRTERARELGKPPYIVAHDRLLVALCETRPRTLAELRDTPGIGPTKLEQFGSDILELVGQHT